MMNLAEVVEKKEDEMTTGVHLLQQQQQNRITIMNKSESDLIPIIKTKKVNFIDENFETNTKNINKNNATSTIYNYNNNNIAQNLGSIELDYSILTSKKHEKSNNTASDLACSSLNSFEQQQQHTQTSLESNQFQYSNNESLLDEKLTQLKAQIESEVEKENENPNSIILNSNNNTKTLANSLSNESLNQVVRIKKIDINKLEETYGHDQQVLSNTKNTTEQQKVFNLDSFLKSLDTISTAEFHAKNKRYDAVEQMVDSASVSSAEVNNNSSSYRQFQEASKTRLHTYPTILNNTNQSQFDSSGIEHLSTKSSEIASQQLNNTVFHPTWDEWKRSHSLNSQQHQQNETANIRKKLTSDQDNKSTASNNESLSTKNTTTFIEETFKSQQKQQKQHWSLKNHQDHQLRNQEPLPFKVNKSEMQSQTTTAASLIKTNKIGKVIYEEYTYNPPQPIIINDASHSPTKQNRSPTKHYPVYPFDAQPLRAPSPVRLSSVVLAKTEAIDPLPLPAPKPEPPLAEIPQPKKIKTILTTQKRKDSAPSLTGWRVDSDSDTEIQSRLLAKASGAMPIEYISIRRDPKPLEKRQAPTKKSITTGTNTNIDHGKRIASTNTNQDEIPQYNLHVSLDSLFVKQRREASTSIERQIQNAATETDLEQRDAFTLTDDEEPAPPPPPPPPPPPVQTHYMSRKSRYSEWESYSDPPETYRLEFLTISPRTVRRKNFEEQQQHHQTSSQQFQQESFSNFANVKDNTADSLNQSSFRQEMRVDDDDRIIFGNQDLSFIEQHSFMKRSGSFPNITPDISGSAPVTRRYVKHTQTRYTPTNVLPAEYTVMPITTVTNGYFSDAESLSQNFNKFNSKFNEVFGLKNNDQFASRSLQRFENNTPIKTERYYKFSRTRNEVPTFGEIYHRNIASQASNLSQCRSASKNFYSSQMPIVEMPATPDSTLRPTSRQAFGSLNNSMIGVNSHSNAAHSSGYSSFSQKTTTSNGPIITPIVIANEAHNNNINNNWFSSSSASSIQHGFEPVVKHKESFSSSSTRNQQQHQHTTHHAFNQKEEEEEIFTSGTEDPDRQFRPIFQPVIEQNNYNDHHLQQNFSYDYSDNQQTKGQWPNSTITTRI